MTGCPKKGLIKGECRISGGLALMGQSGISSCRQEYWEDLVEGINDGMRKIRPEKGLRNGKCRMGLTCWAFMDQVGSVAVWKVCRPDWDWSIRRVAVLRSCPNFPFLLAEWGHFYDSFVDGWKGREVR